MSAIKKRNTKVNPEQTVVIVESPAKCKKIEEYLGENFKCIASCGHFREIKSLQDIDVENNYMIKYTQNINKTKREAMQSMLTYARMVGNSNIVIATDDDREGEAIGWHICDFLGLDIKTTRRIIFHEITRDAVQYAISHPTVLNMKLIQAQKCRQVIDMIVGFRVSPLLWKRFTYGKNNSKTGALSAGRCQIPCLRLVYDNDLIIQKHLNGDMAGSSIYSVHGRFTSKLINFELQHKFQSKREAMEFIENTQIKTKTMPHTFTHDKPYETIISPPKPLNTSRLQQLCSNEQSLSPKDTMACAQKLYENGLITYMRTDASHYSNDFLDTVKKHILRRFNDDRYIPQSLFFLTVPPVCSAKQNNTDDKKEQSDIQHAHESIRPTNIQLENLNGEEYSSFSLREKRLYSIIWRTTMESCMTSATYSKIKCYIHTPVNIDWKYTHITSCPIFMGWQIIRNSIRTMSKNILPDSMEINTDEENVSGPQEYSFLKLLNQKSNVTFLNIRAEEKVLKPPPHYTEAKLVQLLESKGIGRPSTFSSLVDKIQERGYVTKMTVHGEVYICSDIILTPDNVIREEEREVTIGGEKNKLVLQPIGKMVIEYLIKHFFELFDYEYTKRMEDELEKVALDSIIWTLPCDKIIKDIDTIITNMDISDKEKFKVQLGNGRDIVMGRYGPVIKTTQDISGNKITTFESIENKTDDIRSSTKVESNEWGENTPIVKKGKFGLYVEWNGKKIGLSGFGNRPPENISLEEIRNVLERERDGKGAGVIKQLNQDTSIRRSKTGSLYVYFKTTKMRKPEFLKMPKGVNEKNLHEIENAEILNMLNM